jgi:HlyD family secretion protein
MTNTRSRSWVSIAAIILIIAAMAWAFWPRPLLVDIGKVRLEPMTITIDEEGKTQVRNAYVVSTPVAGRLLRIEVTSGDQVEGGKTIIARMLPSNPAALDVRTREQARAIVAAAQAAVRVAQADLNKTKADGELADLDIERKRKLGKSGIISQVAVERAESAWRAARASLDQAKAGISMRQADLANARTRLINFSDQDTISKIEDNTQKDAIPLLAPISGRILRILQESETTLPVGKPILEIGDIANDLEIVAELLSTDAVKVSVGNRVIIRNWGGSKDLNGIVERVDPWGFTKFSALGVEEQRVHTVIRFKDSPDLRKSLGHGFRVETQIVIWENNNALIVPSSALFRDKGNWVVFAVENGVAVLKTVEIDHNNGVQAQVLSGLTKDDEVILFPSSGLNDGIRVAKRR